MVDQDRVAAAVSPWAACRPAVIAAAIGLVVALTAVALHHLLADIRYDDLTVALQTTPWWTVAAALAATAVSFAALTSYDVQALALAGQRLPYPIVALASFCAYAIGNVAGFGPLTGGAVRYRFYAPIGVPPEGVARVVGTVAVSFGIGLAFVASLGLLIADASSIALIGVPDLVVRLGAVAVLVGIAALVVLAGRGSAVLRVADRSFALPSGRSILLQLAATTVDVAGAAAALWVFLPAGAPDFASFLPVYALAVGAGVLSHVPGGIGVFETIVIAGLGGAVPLEGILGALLLYRVVYYAVPLLLAAVALAATELRRAAIRNPMAARATSAMLPPVLATLTLVTGAVLVFSGVTPATDSKLGILETLFPLPLVEGAHFIASIVGVFLIVLARGLVHRLDGAWWAVVVLSAISIPLALVKGLAFGESVMVATLFCALLPTHRVFNRPASLIHDSFSPSWWMCIGVVIVTAVSILLFVFKEVDYSHDLWWQFEFSATAPRSLRAALGISVAAGGIAAWLLTRPPSGRSGPPSDEALQAATAIVRSQAFADANLVRMGDKSLLLSPDRSAFLMYGKHGRSWVALFDPIGDPAARPDLVWRFVEMARAHGGRAVFYQVTPQNLALYADAGLSAFKLGEEAKVRLANFSLQGSRRASMRNALNKAERDGVRFEEVPSAAVDGILDELAAVSDAWVANHSVREKGFSLGAFDRSYVRQQPVAVLRKADRIIAFATLMTTDLPDEATVDLMRHVPDAPNGTMEVLFVHVILHFKGAGFSWFSLGMAPLSGLSESPTAPLWHRAGRAIFDHGESFYNFHGLSAFKSKFDPEWVPRYMAVAGGLNPLLALADVTMLISGGLRGVVGK